MVNQSVLPTTAWNPFVAAYWWRASAERLGFCIKSACGAAKARQHCSDPLSIMPQRHGLRRASVKMSARHTLFAAAVVAATAFALSPASSQTLRYANQGELKSLDPYTLNESTTHA